MGRRKHSNKHHHDIHKNDQHKKHNVNQHNNHSNKHHDIHKNDQHKEHNDKYNNKTTPPSMDTLKTAAIAAGTTMIINNSHDKEYKNIHYVSYCQQLIDGYIKNCQQDNDVKICNYMKELINNECNASL